MELQPLEILKWAGIVLAAGFVGYFGRYLAMLIIEKLRKADSTVDAAAPGAKLPPDEARLKLEKKQAKQAAKSAKKDGRR